MKSLFSVFKSKKQEAGNEYDDGIIVENEDNQQKSGNYEYQPVAEEAAYQGDNTIPAQEYAVQNQDYNYDSDINLQDFVDKAQAYLNSGSQALADAEAKTAELESMDPNSLDYDDLVEEVRSLQAKAGYDFKQAQTLIKTANSLKEQEANV